MNKILDFIAKETDGKNYKSYKYCFELVHIPKLNYEDKKGIRVKRKGNTYKWQKLFRSLSEMESVEAKGIIETNDFNNLKEKTANKKILKLLEHYTITRHDVKKGDREYVELKEKFDHLIKNDPFIDLTLTYDYEDRDTSNVKCEDEVQVVN